MQTTFCEDCGATIAFNPVHRKCKKCALISATKTFFSKSIFPLLCLAALLFIAYKITNDNNVAWLLFLVGIPYGITKMRFWFIGKNQDTSGTMGILFLNIIIGGFLGLIVIAYDILLAIYNLFKFVFSLIKIGKMPRVINNFELEV